MILFESAIGKMKHDIKFFFLLILPVAWQCTVKNVLSSQVPLLEEACELARARVTEAKLLKKNRVKQSCRFANKSGPNYMLNNRPDKIIGN